MIYPPQQLDPTSDLKSDSSMLEAYEALLKTEKEIENLRQVIYSLLTRQPETFVNSFDCKWTDDRLYLI